MAFSSEVARASFTGSGITGPYSFAFKLSNQSYLKVIKRLIASPYTETTLTTTDYTVTGVGDSAGGSITLTSTLSSSYTLELYLDYPVTQPTSIRNQGTYYPATHEDALDYLGTVNKQQQDQLDRCIRQPESEAPIDMELPCTTERASQFLGFDASGKPIAAATVASGVTASAYAQTLLDDASAGAWAATEAAALTEDTTPAIDDTIPTYDTSASTGKKAQLQNVLKVVNGLTADTAPDTADYLLTYDASASAAKKVLLGTAIQGALQATGFWNLGLANATTTNANDSIKIQGAAAALSATNPLYINLPTVSSPGRVTRFSATSDVTIRIDTAHWGLDTKGNFTDIILRVYAINDNGTLKWGVSNKGGYRAIVDTDSTATASSATTQVKMLVNSALTSGTWPCREVGWFLGDFNDTGDLWTVQTAAGEIMVGTPAPVNTDLTSFTPVITAASGGFTVGTGNTSTGFWHLDNGKLRVSLSIRTGSGGGFAAGTGVYRFSGWPTTYVINTALVPTSIPLIGVSHYIDDSGSDGYNCIAEASASTYVQLRYSMDTAADTNFVGAAAPVAMAAGDYFSANFVVPLLGYSGN